MPKIIEAKATLGQSKTDTESTPEENDLCFVIMPYGEKFDPIFYDVISPAIQEAGLIPRRVDDIYRPGDIMRDVWNLTNEAKVVLADLTDRNPNVFYELGLAHALRKPVIIISQSRKDIPFDLRPQRNIEYEKDGPNWGENLKMTITEYIKNTLETPIEEILPAFIEIDDSNSRISDSAAERKIREMVKSGARPNTIFHEMRKHGVDRYRAQEIIYKVEDEFSEIKAQAKGKLN